MSSRISHLTPQLANQIAAGEVIERPASVVKELVENSLDAQANQVLVEIDQGGHKLIRVRDNGVGIHPKDLALAIHRHATSKIHDLSDLEQVSSLGFRGEALASIAAVSRLKLTSCQSGLDSGFMLASNGGEINSRPAPAPHPVGTTISVEDLFFNTPARRKFLRQPKTEFSHIETIVRRLSLSRFDVEFTLKHNQREIFRLASADTEQEKTRRIAKLLGPSFIANAAAIELASSGMQLSGWIGLPGFSRSQADLQFFYINGRFVRDKLLTHAVREAYQGVLYNGRHPAYILYLDMDPNQVDVNVHPTKHEVRFRDGRSVHDFVRRGVSDALAQMSSPQEQASVESYDQEQVSSTPTQIQTPAPASRQASGRHYPLSSKPTQHGMSFKVAEQMEAYEALHPQTIADTVVEETPESSEFPLGFAIAQLHNIYILAEHQQGLVMVDMHAAHERILFEQLKAQLAEARIATQPLLVPQAVSVSPQELTAFEAHQSHLRDAGLEVEQGGPDTLLIRAVPTLLKDCQLDTLLHDLLADCLTHDGTARLQHLIEHILGNMACRAAVHAHRKLTLPEMNALLRKMEKTPHAGVCNHGRPSYVQFSHSELDKFFLRGR